MPGTGVFHCVAAVAAMGLLVGGLEAFEVLSFKSLSLLSSADADPTRASSACAMSNASSASPSDESLQQSSSSNVSAPPLLVTPRNNVSNTFDELVDAAYEMAVSAGATSAGGSKPSSSPKLPVQLAAGNTQQATITISSSTSNASASASSPGSGGGGGGGGRREFNLTQYPQELRTGGGLQDSDRSLLGRIYSSAQSAFEYGLGESTAIASWVGVPRWSGVDSDAAWVAKARSRAPPHYQFHFGDIGPTRAWGYPTNPKLGKQILRYVVAPLELERDPFEVYLVDGRWRVMCACMSFLHAMSRGADMDKVRVLIHDYSDRSRGYHVVEKLADRLEMSQRLAVFKLKGSTTEDDLKAMYLQHLKVLTR